MYTKLQHKLRRHTNLRQNVASAVPNTAVHFLLRSGLRTVVQHRYHDELDTFFHESVGFAEIMILTVKNFELFCW